MLRPGNWTKPLAFVVPEVLPGGESTAPFPEESESDRLTVGAPLVIGLLKLSSTWKPGAVGSAAFGSVVFVRPCVQASFAGVPRSPMKIGPGSWVAPTPGAVVVALRL